MKPIYMASTIEEKVVIYRDGGTDTQRNEYTNVTPASRRRMVRTLRKFPHLVTRNDWDKSPVITVAFPDFVGGPWVWNGGPRLSIRFSADRGTPGREPEIRWGSWEGNFWFWCKAKPTWKESAQVAARRLRAMMKRRGQPAQVTISKGDYL